MSHIEFVPFSTISKTHIAELITNQVPESQTLEFKQAAVGTSDSDRREFLKDVTALANTAGGVLIYGVTEKDRVAVAVTPLYVTDMDSELLRMQNMLLNAVEPRLSNVEMKDVPLGGGGHAIVLKVPQSWRPPHRVTHGGVNRFYLRHSNGVFEPDTEGLREVFNSGMNLERRLENIRAERLDRLATGQKGFKLADPGIFLSQVIPLGRSQPAWTIRDVEQCSRDFLPPLGYSTTCRYNFDGLLIYSPTESNSTRAYSQFFRDWKIEMGRGGFVDERGGARILEANLLVPAMLSAIERSITGLRRLEAVGPFAVMLTIAGLSGSTFSGQRASQSNAIDRDALEFPALLIDTDSSLSSIDRALLPVWDGLWQAYGYSACSLVRDGAGQWIGVPADLRQG